MTAEKTIWKTCSPLSNISLIYNVVDSITAKGQNSRRMRSSSFVSGDLKLLIDGWIVCALFNAHFAPEIKPPISPHEDQYELDKGILPAVCVLAEDFLKSTPSFPSLKLGGPSHLEARLPLPAKLVLHTGAFVVPAPDHCPPDARHEVLERLLVLRAVCIAHLLSWDTSPHSGKLSRMQGQLGNLGAVRDMAPRFLKVALGTLHGQRILACICSGRASRFI